MITAELQRPCRALLHTAGAGAYILALARSFPCLESKLAGWECWDAIVFAKASRSWCHGEIACANFVLTVWNYNEAKKTKRLFDFCDAVSVLGSNSADLAPVLEWMRDPVWP